MPVTEEFPVAIENGEGIIGYQYLHGTNATVGGYQIQGWARLVPGPAPNAPEVPASIPNRPGPQSSADRQVHWYFEYRWNAMIDPNAQYSTDVIKSAFGQVISAGAAADYRISITWRGEGVARLDAGGHIIDVYRPETPSGAHANLYPLR